MPNVPEIQKRVLKYQLLISLRHASLDLTPHPFSVLRVGSHVKIRTRAYREGNVTIDLVFILQDAA